VCVRERELADKKSIQFLAYFLRIRNKFKNRFAKANNIQIYSLLIVYAIRMGDE